MTPEIDPIPSTHLSEPRSVAPVAGPRAAPAWPSRDVGQPRSRWRLGGLASSLILAVVFSGACVMNAGTGGPAPPAGSAAPDLAGTWVSHRASQLGPAGMRFRFACDGEYRTRVRVFLGMVRVREQGRFWVEGDSLRLSRGNGEVTDFRYRLDGSSLWLEESPGEWHEYRRSASGDCPRGS